MHLLKARIERSAQVLPGGIIRVDSFLNHQIDPELLRSMGAELAARFADERVTRVLTVEASGIALAIMTALSLGVPMVFAKKIRGANAAGQFYSAGVRSYTKKIDYEISVSAQYLSADDRVLIVDDFLAMGQAVLGLAQIVAQAGAVLCGAGIAIEKGFQDGGKLLRSRGIRVESLAIVDSLEGGRIVYRDS